MTAVHPAVAEAVRLLDEAIAQRKADIATALANQARAADRYNGPIRPWSPQP